MITLPRILKESISTLELCKAYFTSPEQRPDFYTTSIRSSKLSFKARYKLHALDSILPMILSLRSPPFVHLRRISLSIPNWCVWVPFVRLTISIKGVSDSGKIAKLLSIISNHNHGVGQSTMATSGRALLYANVAESWENCMDVPAELGCVRYISNAGSCFLSFWDSTHVYLAAWNIHSHLLTALNQARLKFILKIELCITWKAGLRGEQIGEDSTKDVAWTLGQCARTHNHTHADDPNDGQSCDLYRIHIPAQIDFAKNILATEWEGVQYSLDQRLAASGIL